MSSYNPVTTGAKAGVPILFVMVVGVVIDRVADKTGVTFPENAAYQVAVLLYGVFAGVKNWFKNRKK